MKKTVELLKLIGIALCIYGLIADFKTINREIIASLTMWARVLVPSLFPYLVISKYLVQSGIPSFFKPIKMLISKLFNISSAASDVYICSLVCGYPCAAVCTSDLYKKGLIKKSEAKRLVCFTNNAGPLFLICAVGGGMLGSINAGFVVYAVQTLSALITGVLLSIAEKEKADFRKEKIRKNAPDSLSSCCEASVGTMLAIGGYIVAVTAVGEIIIYLISKFSDGDLTYARSGVYFFLEISKGMYMLTKLSSTPLSFALICACASWAGVSVIMQITGALPRELLSGKIIISRLIQSIISFCLAFLYSGYQAKSSFSITTQLPIIISLGLSVVIFGYYILNSIRKEI